MPGVRARTVSTADTVHSVLGSQRVNKKPHTALAVGRGYVAEQLRAQALEIGCLVWPLTSEWLILLNLSQSQFLPL